MRTVGLKVLKNRLSEYVRLAAQGETVLIADRDRWLQSWCRRGPPGAISSPTPSSPTPYVEA